MKHEMVATKSTVKLVAHTQMHDGRDVNLMPVYAARVSHGQDNKTGENPEKDEKLVKFLAEHSHTCYDAATEILTDSGWKLFKNLNKKDKVAAVSEDNTFRFETPKRRFTSKYSGYMYTVNSSQVNFSVTGNHIMYVAQRKSDGSYGQYIKAPAEDVYKKNLKVKKYATLQFNNVGDDLDYTLGVLLGMYLGDGYLSSTNYVGFGFKKPRKIHLLEHTLNVLGIQYTKKIDVENTTRFTIPAVHFKEFDITKKANGKRIPYSLMLESEQKASGILHGLLNSDGHRRNRGYEEYSYSSKSDGLLEDVVFLATILGKTAKKRKYNSVSILNRSTESRINDTRLKNSHVKKEYYEGNIYCVEVSTGLLLVRRKGVPLVCGNSPFEHTHATFVVHCPIFVAREWMRHRTQSYNEVSMRYTSDFIGEVFFPDEWRGQDNKNRQVGLKPLAATEQEAASAILTLAYKDALRYYDMLLQQGVCREQARMVIPVGHITKFYASANLLNWAKFCKLRCAEDAQKEIRDLADGIANMLEDLYPLAWKYLHKTP